jgi:hypothetical protein
VRLDYWIWRGLTFPAVLVWFIPRYGRYTKAAIFHDYLCSAAVPAGRISRIEADGMFRQAMREVGVPFLRRWIMWTAVRLGALTNPTGPKKWWTEAWRVAGSLSHTRRRPHPICTANELNST